MKKLFFFGLAGGIGFAVDVAVLYLLLRMTPLDVFSARVLAIIAAMGCTWMFNRSFTFAASGRSLAAEGARYGGVGLTSALINYAIYSAMLISLAGLSPFIAVTVASALATAFSYLGYSRFVFGGK